MSPGVARDPRAATSCRASHSQMAFSSAVISWTARAGRPARPAGSGVAELVMARSLRGLGVPLHGDPAGSWTEVPTGPERRARVVGVSIERTVRLSFSAVARASGTHTNLSAVRSEGPVLWVAGDETATIERLVADDPHRPEVYADQAST